MKLRKRKAETLMEFLIAMSVAGMIFIMISLALQRSTSSVAKIYSQDTLRAAAKKYIAGLPDELDEKEQSKLETVMRDRVSPDVANFTINNLQRSSNLKLWTFDLEVKSLDNEPITIHGVKHFFN